SLPLQSNGTFYPKGALSQDPGNQRFIEKRPQSSYQRFSSAANGTVKEAVGKVVDAKLLGEKSAGHIWRGIRANGTLYCSRPVQSPRCDFGSGNIKEAPMRVICSAVLIVASTAIGMTDVYAQGIEYGKNDYGKFCADCHGATGKGDGKFAKSLKRAPGDLTKLSENNKGVFPALRIYDVIDGRIEVMTHGKRDMPVWGNVFTDELTARLPRDSMSKESSDYLVRRRILSIIEYIST